MLIPWQLLPIETTHPLIEAMETAPFKPDRLALGALSASTARLEEARTLRTEAEKKGRVSIIVQLNQSYSFEPNLGRLPDGADRIAAQRARLAAAQQEVVAALSGRQERVRPYSYTPFVSMRVDAADLDRLLRHPLVAGIEENRPDRPTLAESVPIIRANEAWSAGYTGSGQTVAVLDSGVDKTHPFLNDKVVAEACFSTTDFSNGIFSLCPNGQDQQTGSGAGVNCSATIDGCEHGTHVAGIAAGKGDAFSGVAKEASVIAVQVFSEFTLIEECGETVPCGRTFRDDYNQGLSHVYGLRGNHAIASVNMSLGSGLYSDQSLCDSDRASTKAQIDLLRSAGIATVVASGNEGYVNALSGPACVSTAISVGATWDVSGWKLDCDTDLSVVDKVACFSNSASFLDLLAPGVIINSSVPGGGYGQDGGTSMAAPHVAGCWAILKQAAPSATVSGIETALKTTGKAVTDWRNGLITPRIDCKAALDSLGLPPLTQINLSGKVLLANTSIPICAMVLANGQSQFSCDGAGNFNLANVPLDQNHQVTLYTWAEGFNPYKLVFTPLATNEQRNVAMTVSPCGGVNGPGGSGPGTVTQLDISGQVLLNGTTIPVCAMVLANGQSQFSCDGAGNFHLTAVPVDQSGKVTLYSWAEGFLPYKDVFTPSDSGLSRTVLMRTNCPAAASQP